MRRKITGRPASTGIFFARYIELTNIVVTVRWISRGLEVRISVGSISFTSKIGKTCLKKTILIEYFSSIIKIWREYKQSGCLQRTLKISKRSPLAAINSICNCSASSSDKVASNRNWGRSVRLQLCPIWKKRPESSPQYVSPSTPIMKTNFWSEEFTWIFSVDFPPLQKRSVHLIEITSLKPSCLKQTQSIFSIFYQRLC